MISSNILVMDERRRQDSVDKGLFRHEEGGDYPHLLREVLLTYRRLLRQISAETGLTGSQFELMRELALAGGRSTVSALARELGADPAAVSRLVAGLHKDGLVARVTDDRDGRRRPVVLSKEGRRFMKTFHARAHEREAALASALDPQTAEAAIRALRDLREALDVAGGPAAVGSRRAP